MNKNEAIKIIESTLLDAIYLYLQIEDREDEYIKNLRNDLLEKHCVLLKAIVDKGNTWYE